MDRSVAQSGHRNGARRASVWHAPQVGTQISEPPLQASRMKRTLPVGMQLLPLRVIGPLSECSSSVRVQGQLTGATVQVLEGGREVARAVATWSDETFPLDP